MDVIGTKRQPVDAEAVKAQRLQEIVGAINALEFPSSTPTDVTAIVTALNAVNTSLRELIRLSQKPEQERREIERLDVIRDDSNHRIKTVKVHYK